MKTLGERIKARRQELKLSQRALASILGIAHVSISQWERNESTPKGENLMALAKTLHCEPSWLFEEQGNLPISASELPEAPIKLSDLQKTLLDLFDELPDSEQEELVESLREKKQYYDQLFEQLAKKRIRINRQSR
ncbi:MULTISPECIES: helix-turn-helix domain-containing protein [Arsenophonus]|nr:helix-turn-helix domain-containing protein [Arsenophonus nasoniae]QBY42781.1 helix-turn-helix protein [Arsenophonus nasoniae]WGM06841.1 helix-turn-helix domain-containing protein [Arsenophonus nasoniae]